MLTIVSITSPRTRRVRSGFVQRLMHPRQSGFFGGTLFSMILTIIQTFLQAVWASLLTLGWVNVLIAGVIIAVLSRIQKILGLLATILFIAYLAGWI